MARSPEAGIPINKKNGLQTTLKQFSNARTGHLYIADDNWEFADFVQTVAAGEGWSVSLCSNGSDLVSALEKSCEPAVVYLDLMMPEMDGIETTTKLAQLDRALRVRFVTGGPSHNAEAAELIGGARGLSLGPTIYKPVSLNLLKLELLRDLPYALASGNSSRPGQ